MNNKLVKLIDDIVNGYESTEKDLNNILECDESTAEYLFHASDKVRRQYCGEEIHLRAIVEFSNYCRCACKYCGLYCENLQVDRFRMEPNEIIQYTKEAYEAGYKTIVLQSGEDLWYTKDIISYIIKEIKKLGDIAITLSVGERTYDEYKQWKEDGADRFLIKHETADEDLYNSLHPHSSFNNRVQCLKWLKELGYQAGSGFMIGLPSQTTKTIAKDIMLLKELDVDMAGIGPFISHSETPLKGLTNGDPLMTFKAVALTRIVIKNVHLPATTALETIEFGNRAEVFNKGANVLMRKVEPYKYRGLYDIYPKKLGIEKTVKEERKELEEFIVSIGRIVSTTRGDSKK